ncbi:MAG TPA: hypothetical protein PLQ36_02780, partial [Candidatus Gracilibacteria bacterium]|nr:hypothetical protein [Candidatus Gracilibacteria bacterium]
MIDIDASNGKVDILLVNDSGFTFINEDEVKPFLQIPFTLKEGISIGTKINLNLSELVILEKNTDDDYNSVDATSQNGLITVQNVPETLKIQNSTISNNGVNVQFSDYLKSENLNNIQFEVNNLSSNTTCGAIFDYTKTNIDAKGKGLNLVFKAKNQITTKTCFEVDENGGIKNSDNNTEANSNKLEWKYDQSFQIEIIGENLPVGNSTESLSEKVSYFASKSNHTNKINGVENIDLSSIRVNFSGNIDESANNPTKYLLKNAKAENVKINKISLSGNTAIFNLNQALESKAKYYLLAYQVNGMSIDKIQMFSVKPLAKMAVSSISPNVVDLSIGGTFTVNGSNLDVLKTAKLNDKDLTISDLSSTSFKFTLAANFLEKNEDLVLTLISNNGQILNSNKLVSTSSAQGLQVLEAESYASPARIPNDGKTKTTLWAVINSPNGVSNISQVTADLRPINGSAVAKMLGTGKNGQMMSVNGKAMFYYETVVPNTVKTQSTPYQIKIVVETNKSEKVEGYINLIVSKDIVSSEAPEVLGGYVNPTQLREREKLNIFAQVKDLDGISDLDKVIADLGSLGLGPQILNPIDNVTSSNNQTTNTENPQVSENNTSSENNTNTSVSPSERVSQWYTVKDLVIPNNTKAGTYPIKIIANDKSGEEGLLSLSVQISTGYSPEFDEDRTEITPRRSVPRDGKEVFTITTFFLKRWGWNGRYYA